MTEMRSEEIKKLPENEIDEIYSVLIYYLIRP